MDNEYRELERRAVQGDADAMHAIWARNRRMGKGCPHCGCDVYLNKLIEGLSKKIVPHIPGVGATGGGGEIMLTAGMGGTTNGDGGSITIQGGMGTTNVWGDYTALNDSRRLVVLLEELQKGSQNICMNCGAIFVGKDILTLVKREIKQLSDKYKDPPANPPFDPDDPDDDTFCQHWDIF